MSPWEPQPGHDISDPWRKGPIRGRTIPTSLGPMLTNGVGGGTGRGQAGNVSLVFSVYSKVQLACIRGQVFSLFKLSRRTAEAISRRFGPPSRCVPGFLRIFKSSTRLYLRSGF
jgi:hypothetical protein